MSKVGYRNVELDRRWKTATLKRSGMQLDLGGIAKGYAADQALESLVDSGIPCALVAVAGDIVVGDPPPDQRGWRIEVEPLHDSNNGQTPVVLRLAHQAVSTSGDAYQFVEIDGVRYSHIIDPKTGFGLTTPCSVTVVAPTGMLADGLASTVSVLGSVSSRRLIEQTAEVEAYVVSRSQTGAEEINATPGWNELLLTNSLEPLPAASR
jgi:thiamine biosynthesis lipoprotein